MDNVLKKALFRTPVQQSEVLQAIREVCDQMDCVNARFEMEQNNDLIEACIYEMESLRARYRHLLREAKAQGLTATGLEQAWEKKNIG